MTQLKTKLIEVLAERAPWVPTTQAGKDKQDAEGDASAHAIGALLNTSVADERDIKDGLNKKLRLAAKDHNSKALLSFKRYRELGGDKDLADLSKPFSPRKEWEAAHKADWLKAHPKPKDSFGDRKGNWGALSKY